MKVCRALKNDTVLIDNVKIADRFFQKLMGLLREKSIDDNQGLLLSRCNQVHTFGMKFHIDVIFLSKEGEILHIENDMRPRQISKYVKKTFWTLELKAGAVKKLNIDRLDQLTFEVL